MTLDGFAVLTGCDAIGNGGGVAAATVAMTGSVAMSDGSAGAAGGLLYVVTEDLSISGDSTESSCGAVDCRSGVEASCGGSLRS